MRKFLVVSTLVLAMLSLGLAGCGGSSGTTPTTPTTQSLTGLASCSAEAAEAVICGTAYASDGTTPIIGAEVKRVVSSSESAPLKGLYKLEANSSQCLTDSSGQFACAGLTASGAYDLQIIGGGFTISFSATVTVGEITNIPAADTTATSSESTVKWLVVPGSYDGVQLLLAQLKGCTLTGDASSPASLTGSTECEAANLYVDEDTFTTFSSASNLTTYDSIFINCGTDMSSYATVLQEYVAAGGNMYFSDLADTGLTTAFPNNVTFGTNDTNVGTVTVDVDYAGLATYLGSSTVSIEFDLGIWKTILSVESNVTKYISGDVSSLVYDGTGASYTDAPITVGWKQGTGGCVFYTSYHIEGASTGSSQEKALKYLVLNIDQVCQ